MPYPTDRELLTQARAAGYTWAAFARMLSEEFDVEPGGYMGYKLRLAIQEWLTPDNATVWNRKSLGVPPPDMPEEGVEVFNTQPAIWCRQSS